MSIALTRRQASLLMGGFALALPTSLRAASAGADASLAAPLVVLGPAEEMACDFRAEIAHARISGREVVFADDPVRAWREIIAPALQGGTSVHGLGDSGCAFCLSQLARDERHRFERGAIQMADGNFRCGPQEAHLLAPSRHELTAAWRIHPRILRS